MCRPIEKVHINSQLKWKLFVLSKMFLYLREKCVLMFNQYTHLIFLRFNKMTEWFFCFNLLQFDVWLLLLKDCLFYLVFSVNNTLHPNDLHDYECYKVAITELRTYTQKFATHWEKYIFRLDLIFTCQVAIDLIVLN